MKPLYARVELFDPVSEETFPVVEGITVSVARLDPETQRVDLDRLELPWDEATRCFAAHAPDYETTRQHFLCVAFHKRNFCKQAGRLLSFEETEGHEHLLWAPSRFPVWDSGWDTAYATNEFFGLLGRKDPAEPTNPFVLRVPIRRIYVLGHRGAPHAFPENTLAAFEQALAMGANGIEFDTCLTREGPIAVFHDAMPVKQPPRIDRTLFENLPFELISPRFNFTGRRAEFFDVRDGAVVEQGVRTLRDRHDLDLVRLRFEQARDAYRYAPVEGEEHRVIDLDEFLSFAAEHADRLRLLFFDVKPPGDLGDVGPAREYGRRLAEALRRHERLPERIIVAYADTRVLKAIRKGFEEVGEERCWFAFDAAGGFAPWISGVTRGWTWLPGFVRKLLGRILPGVPSPLRVARRLGTRVVSVGRLGRPAHLREIRRAIRCRDYEPHSKIEMVIHWTLNSREEFAQSIESGVNGVLTDKPDELVAFLAEHGVRVT